MIWENVKKVGYLPFIFRYTKTCYALLGCTLEAQNIVLILLALHWKRCFVKDSVKVKDWKQFWGRRRPPSLAANAASKYRQNYWGFSGGWNEEFLEYILYMYTLQLGLTFLWYNNTYVDRSTKLSKNWKIGLPLVSNHRPSNFF